MPSQQRSVETSRRHAAGFTIVELMVGVVIGLIASLAVAQVLVGSEAQKRTVSAGSDAQVNGALALTTLRRALAPAGYGFASLPSVIGCPLSTSFNGAAVAGFPPALVPINIDDGANGAPDTIRVLSSGKRNFAAPLRVAGNGYDPDKVSANQSFEVTATVGVEGPDANVAGDLLVAAADAVQTCEVFQATGTPTGTAFVPRADTAGWNTAKFPTKAYGSGTFLVNLGRPVDQTFSIVDQSLRVRSLSIAKDGTPSYSGFVELYSDVVQLQALYGKDTNADGTVDAWNAVDPTTNDEWRQVIAVRIAVVTRSTQQEREAVTSTEPEWNVGNAIAVLGTHDCGTSKCLTMKVRKDDSDETWKFYRYRVFETILPLRNMVWNS